MKRLLQALVLMLVAHMVQTTATAASVRLADGNMIAESTLVGDVNYDSIVNMDDLTDLINYLLTNDVSIINATNADVSRNGVVNMDDLTTLIDYLLDGTWPSDDSHQWVDLGLPSGTLWATCNVGASTPEDYGDYFAWGETEPKEVYDWNTYKWCNGSIITLTKYCTNSNYGYNGFVDNKTELDPEDDAAYVNWGENWRMPTKEQKDELSKNCTWTWTTQNGVNGCLVTGPNGKTLFLPAAGYRSNSSLESASDGYYWTRTLYSGYPYYAYLVCFKFEGVPGYDVYRYDGFTVRAVRVPQN